MTNLISKIPKIKVTPEVYKLLPENPGVYIYSAQGKVIYVGKAINLKKRVSSYFRLNLEPKTKKMIEDATDISYIKVTNELEALLLEAKLIKFYLPKYNIVAKDDKHPLYIQITKEDFPRILTVRKTDLIKNKSLAVFGPFPSSKNVKSVLKIIRRIFPYSDHKLGKRGCLYSQIGFCNPCPNEIINLENEIIRNKMMKLYKKNIRHIKSILEGRADTVIKNLEKEMKAFSSDEKYEEASEIHDKVRKLEYIISQESKIESYIENPNLFEDIRNKELKELKEILISNSVFISHLTRIECFDVAHLQGKSATASMVTFSDGVPDKAFYRHFKIIQKKGQDDYESMREIAGRRKKHLDDWGRPDLIIVDGGKGQLSIFLKEYKNEKIPVIGIAKKFETLVIPLEGPEGIKIKEFRLPKGAALNLVQRIRDEAHRFARTYHHKLFSRSLFEIKK